MGEIKVDVMRGVAERSVVSKKITGKEVMVDQDRFTERQERAHELVDGLLSEDATVKAAAKTELKKWFEVQVGADGPKNIEGLRQAIEADSYQGTAVDASRRGNLLEMYYACTMAQVGAIQAGLGKDWESSLIRDAAIKLKSKADWNKVDLVAEAFDNVFGSEVLVGGARAVSENIITDKGILKHLERLNEELEAHFGSREIDNRMNKLEIMEDKDEIAQRAEYDTVRKYLLGLKAEALRLEKQERMAGSMRRKIPAVGAEAGEAGPGGDQYEAGYMELEFPDFVETAQFGEQVPWRIENRPEWYKLASSERKRFFDVTRRVTDGTSWFTFYQNADLEKCWKNPSFKFSGKEMNAFMNADFKKVSGWMLNDLGVFEITSDGVERFVYKLGEGGVGIDKDVLEKIANLEDYQNSLALKLAKERRFVGMSADEAQKMESASPTRVTEMDKLIAANAWNMFFLTFGSSLADVDRVLAPNDRKVSDKIRTLNAEAKARKKLQLFNMAKNVEMTGPNGSLLTAEWFGGGVSAWVEMVLAIEEETGKPLDGKSFLREKVTNGEMWFFDTPLIYSFYDTKEVEVDKRDTSGQPVYKKEIREGSEVFVEVDGKKVPEKEMVTIGKALYEERDFKFKEDENDIMSDFRDETEAAVRTWTVLVGKSQIKGNDLDGLTNELRSAVGLLSQIKSEGKLPGRISRIVTTPEFWAMCMVNTFGPDLDVLSTNGIYIEGAISDASYGNFIKRIYNQFQLNSFVNPDGFKKFLRADVGFLGRVGDKIGGVLRNQTVEIVYKEKWNRVELQYQRERLNEASFVTKEAKQLVKWRNQSLENGDSEAVNRFNILIAENSRRQLAQTGA